jgi:pimeloyl-ACP methyl ester carboxylesterase
MDLLLPWRRKNLPGRYKPQCPTLYIYGAQKPVMFHSQRWLDILKQTGGRHECIADGDHWFMESHPDTVNPWIRDWFTDSTKR